MITTKLLKFILVTFFLTSFKYLFSQEYVFVKSISCINDMQRSHSVIPAHDNGYAIVGVLKTDQVSFEIALFKCDSSGNPLWGRILGGPSKDSAVSIVETQDHGFILAGYTQGLSGNDSCALVSKFDSSGSRIWVKFITSNNTNFKTFASSVISTTDSNYVVCINAEELSTSRRSPVLIKIDEDGNPIWIKPFIPLGNYFNSIIKTNDGGYAAIGANLLENSLFADILICKFDSSGNYEWGKKFGSALGNEEGYSLLQLSDSSYIATGITDAFAPPDTDILILKFDKLGNLLWGKIIRRENTDCSYSIISSYGNGFVLSGYTKSFGPNSDGLIAKFDENGNLFWTYVFDTGWEDKIFSVTHSQNNGYTIAGFTGNNSSTEFLIGRFLSSGEGCIGNYVNMDIFDTPDTLYSSSAYILSPDTSMYEISAQMLLTVMLVSIDTNIICEEQVKMNESLLPDNFPIEIDIPCTFQNEIQVNFSHPLSNPIIITIHDIKGASLYRKIYELKNHTMISINGEKIEKLIPGLYFISIQSKGLKTFKKIIKLNGRR